MSPVQAESSLSIYIAPDHNSICHKVLWIILLKRNTNNQVIRYKQPLGDGGKEKLPFNKKTPSIRSRLGEGQPSAVTVCDGIEKKQRIA